MNDIKGYFKGRDYPRKYAHVTLHYSKSDERIILTIIDKKRIGVKHNQRDAERLNQIYSDLIYFLKDIPELELK